MALARLQRYCAYQDRCHQEVRSKLLDLKVYGDDLEWVMDELIKEKFLDELRFAQSFARGKFRNNKWGKIKIKIELKKKAVTDYCIRKAMNEIDPDDYEAVLQKLIQQKWDRTKAKSDYERKQKTAAFAIGKGFENKLVWPMLDKLTKA
ncbi:MAG: RecX family transcriptional regulator [Bacteroidota bacterium]